MTVLDKVPNNSYCRAHVELNIGMGSEMKQSVKKKKKKQLKLENFQKNEKQKIKDITLNNSQFPEVFSDSDDDLSIIQKPVDNV